MPKTEMPTLDEAALLYVQEDCQMRIDRALTDLTLYIFQYCGDTRMKAYYIGEIGHVREHIHRQTLALKAERDGRMN